MKHENLNEIKDIVSHLAVIKKELATKFGAAAGDRLDEPIKNLSALVSGNRQDRFIRREPVKPKSNFL